MISKDDLKDILKNKGIDLEKIVTDERVYVKACTYVYKTIPIPIRWFVGKKRAQKLVDIVKDQVKKKTK